MTTKLFALLFLIFCSSSFSFAQDDYDYEEEDTTVSRVFFGVNVGAYFANNKTAAIYSGSSQYGINYIFGQRDLEQTFRDYFVYPYSIGEYPIKPSYKTTAELGAHLGYQISNTFAVFIDFNSIQLKSEQFFTVAIEDPKYRNTLEPKRYEKIPIYGKESRFNLNLGTQISYYHEEETNAYIALFGNANGVKLKENYFVIDQVEYHIQHPIDNDFNRKPGGIAYGYGGGLGLKFGLAESIIVDLFYNLYYNQTYMTEYLKPYGFNHDVGLRIIWKQK